VSTPTHPWAARERRAARLAACLLALVVLHDTVTLDWRFEGAWALGLGGIVGLCLLLCRIRTRGDPVRRAHRFVVLLVAAGALLPFLIELTLRSHPAFPRMTVDPPWLGHWGPFSLTELLPALDIPGKLSWRLYDWSNLAVGVPPWGLLPPLLIAGAAAWTLHVARMRRRWRATTLDRPRLFARTVLVTTLLLSIGWAIRPMAIDASSGVPIETLRAALVQPAQFTRGRRMARDQARLGETEVIGYYNVIEGGRLDPFSGLSVRGSHGCVVPLNSEVTLVSGFNHEMRRQAAEDWPHAGDVEPDRPGWPEPVEAGN